VTEKPNFAMVYRHEDPIFDGTVGATTMRVWVQVSRWALTDPRKVTIAKPLGHVVAGEQRLAEALHLTVKTVRGHLRRLQSAGLLVLWRAPRRGAILPSHDGGWRGLAAEYLVTPMADEGVVASVPAREIHRRGAAPGPTVHKTARIRGADGRFSRSDHDATGNPLPVATGNPLPVATGNPLPSYETLVDETLDDETQLEGRVEREGSTCVLARDKDIGNRKAYVMLDKAEAVGELPSLTKAERAGIAHALTAVFGLDVDAIQESVNEAAAQLDWESDAKEVQDVFSEVLQIDSASMWWDTVKEQASQTRARRGA
jgi:hypothetical protein